MVNGRESDAEQAILQLTGAEKVTAVIDTIQTEEAQQMYMSLFRTDQPGQIVYSGFTPGKAWANMGHLQQRELTCYFVSGWTRRRMEATIALMADKRLALEPLITHVVGYKQAPQAYAMLLANKEPFLGVIIDWKGADL